jgi:hypothetical protein
VRQEHLNIETLQHNIIEKLIVARNAHQRGVAERADDAVVGGLGEQLAAGLVMIASGDDPCARTEYADPRAASEVKH